MNEVSKLLWYHILSKADLKLSTLVLQSIFSGKPFQALMHLKGNEFDRNDLFTCFFSSRKMWLRVLLSLKVKNLLALISSILFIILNIWIRSYLCLLYKSVGRLSSLNLFSYVNPFSSGTLFVALLWIFSIN